MSFESDARDRSPHPGNDPAARLRHTLDVYADAPDDRFVIEATRGIWGDNEVTGLTFGDLRALARQIGA